MRRFAHGVANHAGYRWGLALALALGLHGAVLFGVSADRWTLRFSSPQPFRIVLLPTETVVLPSAPEPVPRAGPDPVPPPVSRPAAITRPKPAATPAATLAPKLGSKSVSQPNPRPKSTPAVKPAPAPVAKPLPASGTPVATARAKAIQPTRSAALATPPKPSPPAPLPRAGEGSQRVRSTPAEPVSRSTPLAPAPNRLSSAALLSQVARLETENQRRQSVEVRTQRVALTDTRSAAGFYAADWARKVTRVGEMNFPDVARQLNLSAGPLLEVAIHADGRLREVRILRSSGNAELDRSAQRIVQLAAPYPPFPEKLRQQADLLRIESPWRFDPGGRVRAR